MAEDARKEARTGVIGLGGKGDGLGVTAISLGLGETGRDEARCNSGLGLTVN